MAGNVMAWVAGKIGGQGDFVGNGQEIHYASRGSDDAGKDQQMDEDVCEINSRASELASSGPARGD